MAISHHQEIVVQYLTADPRLFVSEEYYVAWGRNKGESIWIDAVAVDPHGKEVFLVEVTSDPKATQIIRKLNTLYSDQLPTVRAAMLGQLGLADEWRIRPWIFVRDEAVPRVLERIHDRVVPKITYLHTTAWEWEYHEARRKGEEPGKPYEGVAERYQR